MKKFTVAVSWHPGKKNCQTEAEALTSVNWYLRDIKERVNVSYELRRCRTVREPNLQKIGLSFAAPESILWERHWLLHGDDGSFEEITITESWV
jgi:hypothetical protein